MQRFKFRAWDGEKMYTWKESGLMENSSFFEFHSYKREVKEGMGVRVTCFVKNWNDKGLIIMQNTGCKELANNGKEVWESDIIEESATKERKVVYWDEYEASWYCRYINDERRIDSLIDSLNDLNKVVGNIYENPELLKNTIQP